MTGDDWPCEAYGPEGLTFGARCFRAAVDERVCADPQACARFLTGERQRVYQRIAELAAAGDPAWAYVESQVNGPDELLGGGGGESESGPDAQT